MVSFKKMKILPNEYTRAKSQHSAILADQWLHMHTLSAPHIFFNLCWLCKYFRFEFVSVFTSSAQWRTKCGAIDADVFADAGNCIIYLLICTLCWLRVRGNYLEAWPTIAGCMLMSRLLSGSFLPVLNISS